MRGTTAVVAGGCGPRGVRAMIAQVWPCVGTPQTNARRTVTAISSFQRAILLLCPTVVKLASTAEKGVQRLTLKVNFAPTTRERGEHTEN